LQLDRRSAQFRLFSPRSGIAEVSRARWCASS
jgi:hypothetical protein